MKKILTAALVICVLVFAVGLVLPVIYLPRPDIIGGADVFTYRFYMSSALGKVCLSVMQPSAAGAISCAVYLCLSAGFEPRRAVCALGLSAALAAAACCGLIFASCFVMTSPHRHPIALPASVIGGCICCGLLCLFGYIYKRLWAKTKSKRGLLADITVCAVFFLPFVYLFSCACDIASGLIK